MGTRTFQGSYEQCAYLVPHQVDSQSPWLGAGGGVRASQVIPLYPLDGDPLCRPSAVTAQFCTLWLVNLMPGDPGFKFYGLQAVREGGGRGRSRVLSTSFRKVSAWFFQLLIMLPSAQRAGCSHARVWEELSFPELKNLLRVMPFGR